jgi:hypothetical protein
MGLLLDNFQHVARLGNMREVELRPNLIRARPAGTRLLAGSRFCVPGKVTPHFFRFIRFN